MGAVVAGLALAPGSLALAERVQGKASQMGTAVAAQAQGGWQTTADGTTYYLDAEGNRLTGDQLLPARDGSGSDWYYFRGDGSLVTGELFRNDDPAHTGWYYFDDTTGAMVHGWRDISSSGGKRVYYDPVTGIMWHGEGYVAMADASHAEEHAGWYYFDEVTGATQYGWRWVASNGGKWVYYDPTYGYMRHGEAYVKDDIPGWCYFDEVTGATTYGWRYIESGDKWVYYDPYTGRMWHGEGYVAKDDAATDDPIPGWCYFDEATGATTYGWKHLADGRYVYYDDVTGRMLHGDAVVNGAAVRFDEVTGAFSGSLADAVSQRIGSEQDSVVDTLIAERLAAGSPASVRILGDSISAGVGTAAVIRYDGNPIVTKGETFSEGGYDYPTWANLLRPSVASLFNAAIPSKSMVWFSELAGLPTERSGERTYDQTLVMLGTNDGDYTPEAFEEAARKVITEAKESSDSVVVISPIPRREEGQWLPMETVSAIERRLSAEMGVSFIDLYQDFEQAAGAQGLTHADLYWDLVHPNADGQQVIWGVIRARLGL